MLRHIKAPFHRFLYDPHSNVVVGRGTTHTNLLFKYGVKDNIWDGSSRTLHMWISHQRQCALISHLKVQIFNNKKFGILKSVDALVARSLSSSTDGLAPTLAPDSKAVLRIRIHFYGSGSGLGS